MVRLKADDPNLDALIEIHMAGSRDPLVIQKFIPAVSKGDKRIILIDGEPVGAINRVPAEGQVRSNLRVGGTAAPVELTARDLEICAIIGPELKARGLMFVGIDVIGDYLTEINVTSPDRRAAAEGVHRHRRRRHPVGRDRAEEGALESSSWPGCPGHHTRRRPELRVARCVPAFMGGLESRAMTAEL